MLYEGFCTICAMVTNEPEEGWVYETSSWVAGILPGLEIPGWIVLALRRHDESPAPLNGQESRELGQLITGLQTALAATTEAERIYLQAYGEKEAHFHLLFAARGPEIPVEHRHVQFFLHRNSYLDLPRAHQVAAKVRNVLNTDGDIVDRAAQTPRECWEVPER